MDLAAALRAFIRTAERGSVTAAARDLGVSQPAVSKLLRNLEAHVGARLFERHSRALRPTVPGARLYDAVQGPLSAIDAAIESVRDDGGAIRGGLRLHGPVCLGERRVHAIVMAFQERHPDVSVRLTLENRHADLVHEGIDLAIRAGRPTGEDIVMRRVGLIQRILVATPAYLERCGAPREPECLLRHAVLATDTVLGRDGSLALLRGGEATEIRVTPILTTNNAQVLVDAILASRGVGTAQVQLVAEALSDGRLLRVLREHEIRPTELYVAYPSARFLRPAVRAFIDFAIPRLQAIEGVLSDPAEAERPDTLALDECETASLPA